MKLVILGATGGVGHLLLRGAIERGADVTVIARDKSRVEPGTGCRAVEFDLHAATPRQLSAVIAGNDAVISALGSRTARDLGVLGRAAETVVAAMRRTGVTRYLGISAAPVATVPSPARPNPPKHDPGDDFLARHMMMPIIKRVFAKQYADSAVMEDVVRASGLDWTLLRPPRLVDRPVRGAYRTSIDSNLPGGRAIGRGDLAAYLLDAVTDTETFGHSVGIAY